MYQRDAWSVQLIINLSLIDFEMIDFGPKIPNDFPKSFIALTIRKYVKELRPLRDTL